MNFISNVIVFAPSNPLVLFLRHVAVFIFEVIQKPCPPPHHHYHQQHSNGEEFRSFLPQSEALTLVLLTDFAL